VAQLRCGGQLLLAHGFRCFASGVDVYVGDEKKSPNEGFGDICLRDAVGERFCPGYRGLHLKDGDAIETLTTETDIYFAIQTLPSSVLSMTSTVIPPASLSQSLPAVSSKFFLQYAVSSRIDFLFQEPPSAAPSGI
jgi:hypothetical protein